MSDVLSPALRGGVDLREAQRRTSMTVGFCAPWSPADIRWFAAHMRLVLPLPSLPSRP